KIVAQTLPAFAAIFRQIHITGSAAKTDAIARGIQCVTKDDVVRIFLGQTFAQRLPALTAIGCARDKESTINGHALQISLRRDHPGSAAILVICGYGKTEMRTQIRLANLGPGFGAVLTVKHTAVILLPEVKIGRASCREC